VSSLLRCTVRGCGRPLTLDQRAARCEAGHAFDRAKGGYWNLLQPQDRRAPESGDAVETARARRALFLAGHDDPVIDWVADRTPAGSALLDVGCGEGSLLASVAARSGSSSLIGVDLSTRAQDMAARSYPAGLWVVANADRGLPLVDASIDVALSITGRRPSRELRRVLRASGTLIIGVPAPEDLRELRQLVQGSTDEGSRVERIVEELRADFELVAHERRARRDFFDPSGLERLLVASYRAARGRLAKLRGVAGLEVTIARDLLLLRPR
jgi:23S rRNA (guanine745-N1)-methyltransferase